MIVKKSFVLSLVCCVNRVDYKAIWRFIRAVFWRSLSSNFWGYDDLCHGPIASRELGKVMWVIHALGSRCRMTLSCVVGNASNLIKGDYGWHAMPGSLWPDPLIGRYRRVAVEPYIIGFFGLYTDQLSRHNRLLLPLMLDMLAVWFTCICARHWFQSRVNCGYAYEKPLSAQHSWLRRLKMLWLIAANIAECTWRFIRLRAPLQPENVEAKRRNLAYSGHQ